MKIIFRGHSASLINHLFQTLLIAYLVLLVLEQVWTGFVSAYLELNWLLAVVVAVGILSVFSKAEKKDDRKPGIKDYIFVCALGLLGFIIIVYKTGDLGFLRWVIGLIAGVLIVLLSLLVLNEEEEVIIEKGKKMDRRIVLGAVFGSLVLLSLIVWIFSDLGFPGSFRVVFGSVLVLFVPGYIWTYVFFKKKEIDFIERIALSFALSISIVPLVVFYLNLLGLRISVWSTLFVVIFVSFLGFVVYWLKIKKIWKAKHTQIHQ